MEKVDATAGMLARAAKQKRVLKAWKAAFPCNSVILDPTMDLEQATRVPVAKCASCAQVVDLVARIATVARGASYVGSSLEQVSRKARHLNLKCACGGSFHPPVLGLLDVPCAFSGTLWAAQKEDDESRNDDPTLYKIAPSATKASDIGMEHVTNPFVDEPARATDSVPVIDSSETPTPEDTTNITLLCSTYKHKVLPWVRDHGLSSAGYVGPVFKSFSSTKAGTEMCASYCAAITDVKSSVNLDGRCLLWTREAQYVGKKPWVFGSRTLKPGTPTDQEMVTRTFGAPSLLAQLLDKAVVFLKQFIDIPWVLRQCLESETCHFPRTADERLTVWRLETHNTIDGVTPYLDLTCRDVAPAFGLRRVPQQVVAWHPVVVVTCELDVFI